MEHIESVCSLLAKEQHIKRHDKLCAQLYFNTCKETGVKLHNKHWHDYVPKSVKTSHAGKVTILWNQQMRTFRTVPKNELDIIIHDFKQGTCILINVAIPGDRRDQERRLEYFKI